MPLFFAFVTFAAIIIYIAFAVYIIARNIRSTTSQLLFLINFSLIIWGISELGMRLVDSPEQATWWSKFGGIGYALVGSFFLHYILYFTQSRFLEKKWLPILIYLPGVVLLYLTLNTDIIISGAVQEFHGYVATIGKLFWALVAEIDIVFVVGLILAWRFYRTSRIFIEKKQALLVMIGISVPLIIGSITDGLLPILGVQSPRSVVTASVFMVAFFTYANIRYGLINPTPAMAAKSMANAMSDSLILLSPDLRIELVNPATTALLGYQEADLLNKQLGVLVGDKVGKQLKRAIEQGEDLRKVELAYKPKTGSIIPMKLSFSTLKDSNGKGLLGIVIIGREARKEQAIIEKLKNRVADSREKLNGLKRVCDNYEEKLISFGLMDRINKKNSQNN